MTNFRPFPVRSPGHCRQRGAATLFAAIMLLIILSIITLLSANVGVFEMKTATNENRSRLTQNAANGVLDMSVEWVKANQSNIASNVAGTGWLDPSSPRWTKCTATAPSGQFDPCTTQRVSSGMYRYQVGSSTSIGFGSAFGAAAVSTVGSPTDTTKQFSATPQVTALLCRMDTSNPTPFCSDDDTLDPKNSRAFAVTLVSNVSLGTENAAAVSKQTVMTFRTIGGAANVPLIASGTVEGLGNASIVTSPNASGWGVPASIWSPNEVDVDDSGSGVGSISTCQMGEYLGSVPLTDLFTTCASGNSCGCPNSTDSLSGHLGGSAKRENIDILDIDGAHGALPDISFYPSHRTAMIKTSPTATAVAQQLDDQAETTDDSLFEWIFAQDVVDGTGTPSTTQPAVKQTCGPSGNADCARDWLAGAANQVVNNCSGVNAASTGFIWVDGSCSLNSDVGSPDHPVVLVVEDSLDMTGNNVIYGMLFVRSSTNTASMFGRGNVTVFGSVVVEGNVNMRGGLTIVYSQAITDAINNSSDFNKVARLPGSWLDSRSAF